MRTSECAVRGNRLGVVASITLVVSGAMATGGETAIEDPWADFIGTMQAEFEVYAFLPSGIEFLGDVPRQVVLEKLAANPRMQVDAAADQVGFGAWDEAVLGRIYNRLAGTGLVPSGSCPIIADGFVAYQGRAFSPWTVMERAPVNLYPREVCFPGFAPTETWTEVELDATVEGIEVFASCGMADKWLTGPLDGSIRCGYPHIHFQGDGFPVEFRSGDVGISWFFGAGNTVRLTFDR